MLRPMSIMTTFRFKTWDGEAIADVSDRFVFVDCEKSC
jgi:hypothetical protein